jgi:hypothetical protein
VPSHPPFIGRRRDFYILKTPSHSKNIPNVNTYMKNIPKPGLFGTTTLTLLLTGSWIFLFVTSEPDLWHILEFPSPEVRDFSGSRFQTFACLRLRGFTGSSFLKVARPRPRGFAGSRFPKITCLRFQGFADSRFLKIVNALPLKTHLKNFVKLDVSRVTGFPESPTLVRMCHGSTRRMRFV